MNQKNQFKLAILLALVSFFPSSIFALGTYAEGSVVGKIIQFESRGIIFESYEGVMEVTKFEKEEKCDATKDDVKEVKENMECGIAIKNFNDIKVGDIVEAYEITEVKQTLK